MGETVVLEDSKRVIKSIPHRIYLHRALVVRRLAVLLLLLYFAVLVDAGSSVFRDSINGLYSGGMSMWLFPFPSVGYRMLPAYVPLTQIDVFIYIVFINQGIWIAWMLPSVIYIMMPLPLWAYRTLKRPISKSTKVPHEKEERVGSLTSAIVIFSIVLSVATFSFHINLVNYGPVPLVVVLGISTTLVFTIFYEVLKRLQR